MTKIKPLSGRGKDIIYTYNKDVIEVKWADTKLNLRRSIVKDIIDNFFIDKDKWYLLGACEDNPIKNGLGDFITLRHKLTPRHSSVIAAIMFSEGLIQYRGIRPIELKKI